MDDQEIVDASGPDPTHMPDASTAGNLLTQEGQAGMSSSGDDASIQSTLDILKLMELEEKIMEIKEALDFRTKELESAHMESSEAHAKLSEVEADLKERNKELGDVEKLLGEEKRRSTKLETRIQELQQQGDVRSKEIVDLNDRLNVLNKSYKKALERLESLEKLLKTKEKELERYRVDRPTSERYLDVEKPGTPRFYVETRGDALSCGYSFSRRMVLWVQEYIGKDDAEALKLIEDEEESTKKGKFKCDEELHNCLTDDEYKKLNKRKGGMYSRGHMAREGNYRLLTHRKETCRYSNSCPQHRKLNEGAWLYLENLVLEWAKECSGLWVCCGPMWIGNCTLTIGDGANAVHVPSHFYKVILLEKNENKEIRAFRFPNEEVKVDGNIELLKRYEVHVEEVETYLGAEMFPYEQRQKLMVSDW